MFTQKPNVCPLLCLAAQRVPIMPLRPHICTRPIIIYPPARSYHHMNTKQSSQLLRDQIQIQIQIQTQAHLYPSHYNLPTRPLLPPYEHQTILTVITGSNTNKNTRTFLPVPFNNLPTRPLLPHQHQTIITIIWNNISVIIAKHLMKF